MKVIKWVKSETKDYSEGTTIGQEIDAAASAAKTELEAIAGSDLVTIAEQTATGILGGLAAAHEAGIVHRDLKPENVLLADDGRIKIGDFGLARATTANTASGQALLGTIAYLSPELLTRGVADARSDIYAAGIMMFEMLTGSQPYQGEQPMQIAYQHANDQVPLPSSRNPMVPASLDDIVRWGTQRVPESRPKNASEMLDALHIAEPEIRHGVHTTTIPTQQTVVMPANAQGSDNATTVLEGNETAEPLTATGRLRALTSTKRKRSLIVGGVIIALALLAGGLGWFFAAGPGSYVPIPVTAGQAPEIATAALKDAGFQVTPKEINSTTIKKGLVIDTDPSGGSRVPKGAALVLNISLGPKMIAVPATVGLPQTDAEKAITAAPFTLKTVTTKFDATVASGLVIAALSGSGKPLGDTYAELGNVTLIVSAGPLPDVVGKPQADAFATLTAAGLKPQVASEEYSTSVAKGSVVSLNIPEGGLGPGDTVGAVISKGPEMITIPDVIGDIIADAASQLTALGFVVTSHAPDVYWSSLRVLSMSEKPGTQIAKGSTIELYNP
jgi:serine/threonine-protein kinase